MEDRDKDSIFGVEMGKRIRREMEEKLKLYKCDNGGLKVGRWEI